MQGQIGIILILIIIIVQLTPMGTYYRVASDNSYIDIYGLGVTKIKKLTSTELVVYPMSDYKVELYFTKISN